MKLCRYLNTEKKEFLLSKQLLRSGTAIGALVREAEQAESKADFIHKMAIALKEANETDYWTDLLHQAEIINHTEFKSINPDILIRSKRTRQSIRSLLSDHNDQAFLSTSSGK